MKFKSRYKGLCKGITIRDRTDGAELVVETREDGKTGLFILSEAGIFLTKSKALKLAYAILQEMDPLL